MPRCLLEQRILRQPERDADGKAAQLRAPHQREVDGDEQRQFDLRHELQRLKQWQVDLDQQRQQGYGEVDPERVTRAAHLARAVHHDAAAGWVIHQGCGEVSGGFAAGGFGAGGFGAGGCVAVGWVPAGCAGAFTPGTFKLKLGGVDPGRPTPKTCF